MQIIRAHVPRAGGTFTGPVLFPDGSVAAPAIAFANNPDTGILYATDIVLFTINGVAGVRVGNGAIGGVSYFFDASSGNEFLKFTNVASAVNEITITNAATGNPAIISASGGDTNIDIALTPKGTGVLRFGTHSALGAETVSGYITIKDAGGVARKVAVVS